MARSKAFDRTVVLGKAMELFWKKGFHATSVQDLVDHVGINRASMYDTFISKEHLFFEALSMYQQSDLKALRAFDGDPTQARIFIKDFLNGLVQHNVNDIDHKGCFIANTLTESNTQTNNVLELLRENKEDFTNQLCYLIGMARNAGHVQSAIDDLSLARHLFAFAYGMNVVSHIEHNGAHLQSMVDTQLTLLFGADFVKG